MNMDSTAIADYALIGDTRTAALVHRSGSIDWMCVPRFDSEPLFGRLIDGTEGGHFLVAIGEADVIQRSYEGATLTTLWRGPSGEAEVRDTLVADVTSSLLPGNLLVREVRCLRGDVKVIVHLSPRLGLPGAAPEVSTGGPATSFTWGSLAVGATSDLGPNLDPGKELSTRMTGGESRAIALSIADREPIVFVTPGHARDLAAADSAWWVAWLDHISYEGPEKGVVERSLMVLRMLTYSPSGAPVAAPTTSLPVWIGSVRNWDYRYSWPRDASIGISAFLDVGLQDEARAFMNWLLHAARVTRPRIEVMYTLDGNPAPAEREVEVTGFQGSRPVRIGNDARGQFQLDVYGWVIDAFIRLTKSGQGVHAEMVRAMGAALDFVADHWAEPDHGVWEVRGERKHYVHSKMMCWLALDQALQSEVFRGRNLNKWKSERDAISQSVRDHGFDRELGRYCRRYEATSLDAAVLIPLPDFETDPKIIDSTIDAIRGELGAGGTLLYRYPPAESQHGPQGAFLPCTFWMIQALARTGRLGEAEEMFAEACRLGNDLALFSEGIHPESGIMLGNFPQALTHGSLVIAGQAIQKAREDGRRSRG